MLEKPDLPDAVIVDHLQARYGLEGVELRFLPIGNDSNAWVYRVTTHGSVDYFLKVKRGTLYVPSLVVPRALKDGGEERVVAPIAANDGRLWVEVGDYHLIIYPFIEGENGAVAGLAAHHWTELGRALRRLHGLGIEPGLLAQIHLETFIPSSTQLVRKIQRQIVGGDFSGEHESEMAAYWIAHLDQITQATERADALGLRLQNRPVERVLCHADIHRYNVMIDLNRQLHIVDWDQPVLAPKERDLMFIVGGVIGGPVSAEEEAAFFRGYGETTVDPLNLAYYRYDWVTQDIGDYGERVFLRNDVGDVTKQGTIEGFRTLFNPGDEIDAAFASDIGDL